MHPSSTPPSAARKFLEGKGITTRAPKRAYALLASYAEAETADRCGTKVLAKLKRTLHTERASPYEKQTRKLEIAQLVREVQHRRRLTSPRDQYGALLTEPLQMAKALQENLAGIMAAGTKSVAECVNYLNLLPLPAHIKGPAPMLLRPLNEELVRRALENMKAGSSPGIDGVPAEIFMALADTLVPRMTQSIARMLQRGAIPPGRALGLLSPIPKEAELMSTTALRPICLQNVLSKWI